VASAKRLVDDLRTGAQVAPTRGAPLCTFKDTARILAGFPDEREGAVEAGGSAGPASLIGLRLAKGENVPARVVHPRGGGAPQDQPSAEHLSSHDAPQDTSASDPSHPAGPAAEEGE
jgi:NADH-quinone oxidoreductase subunit E